MMINLLIAIGVFVFAVFAFYQHFKEKRQRELPVKKRRRF
jgi:hypothetical protein